MNISVHLCGSAYAYEPNAVGHSKGWLPVVGRPQGSLINQQKRSIANAVEWIRTKGSCRPLIFVATSPGYTHAANERKIVSTFCHNLRNGYDCKDYVWVRELTKMGFPHFHFVAAIPRRIDFVSVSRYWSGLFDSDAVNSVRFGTHPKEGRRKYYVENQAMAWYLSKYLGKGLSKELSYLADAGFPSTHYRKTYRQFAISQECAEKSQPKIYEAHYSFHQSDEMVLSGTGKMVQAPAKVIGRAFKDTDGNEFNPHRYEWKQHPIHRVWFGTKKTIKAQLEIYDKRANRITA